MPASKKGHQRFSHMQRRGWGPSDGNNAGAGDPARERLTTQLAGREIGGDQGATRREGERGTGDVTREMGSVW